MLIESIQTNRFTDAFSELFPSADSIKKGWGSDQSHTSHQAKQYRKKEHSTIPSHLPPLLKLSAIFEMGQPLNWAQCWPVNLSEVSSRWESDQWLVKLTARNFLPIVFLFIYLSLFFLLFQPVVAKSVLRFPVVAWSALT